MNNTKERLSGIGINSYKFLIHRVRYLDEKSRYIETAGQLEIFIPEINIFDKKINKISITFYSNCSSSRKVEYATGLPGEYAMLVEMNEKDLNIWQLALLCERKSIQLTFFPTDPGDVEIMLLSGDKV